MTANEQSQKSWIPTENTLAPSPSMVPIAAVGNEASWERTRADAARVDPRDVTVFTGTATVVLHNVRTGVEAVLAERAWFEAQDDGPTVDFARIAAATDAAHGLVFAAGRVVRRGPSKRGLRDKIKTARTTLGMLRVGADALVAAGVIDAVPPSAGTGPTGLARDCIAYASLFRTHRAKTRHVTAVTATHITQAAKLGTELLEAITPKGAPVRYQRDPEAQAAADDRDRIAVVVAERYHYVERAAGWRWGSAAAEHVPPMLARAAGRGEAEGDDDALDDEDEVDAEETRDVSDEDAEGDEATSDDARDEEAEPPAAKRDEEPAAKRDAEPAKREEPAAPPAAKAKTPRSAKKR
jgi:hypothetical protein